MHISKSDHWRGGECQTSHPSCNCYKEGSRSQAVVSSPFPITATRDSHVRQKTFPIYIIYPMTPSFPVSNQRGQRFAQRLVGNQHTCLCHPGRTSANWICRTGHQASRTLYTVTGLPNLPKRLWLSKWIILIIYSNAKKLQFLWKHLVLDKFTCERMHYPYDAYAMAQMHFSSLC